MNWGHWVSAATALIAAALSWWGAYFTYANGSRELDIRMVDVALTILSGSNENTKTPFAKRYAFDLLDKYSGVKIKDREAWEKEGSPLNFGPWPSNGQTPFGWCFYSKEDCKAQMERMMESGFWDGKNTPPK